MKTSRLLLRHLTEEPSHPRDVGVTERQVDPDAVEGVDGPHLALGVGHEKQPAVAIDERDQLAAVLREAPRHLRAALVEVPPPFGVHADPADDAAFGPREVGRTVWIADEPARRAGGDCADLMQPVDHHEQIGAQRHDRRPDPAVAAVLLVPVDLQARVGRLALGFGAVAMAVPVGGVQPVELVGDRLEQQRLAILAQVLDRVAELARRGLAPMLQQPSAPP